MFQRDFNLSLALCPTRFTVSKICPGLIIIIMFKSFSKCTFYCPFMNNSSTDRLFIIIVLLLSLLVLLLGLFI